MSTGLDLPNKYFQNHKRTALAETLDEPGKDHLRATVYSFYKNKQVPTLTEILDKLQTEEFYYNMNKDTLSKYLKSIGFKHKIISKRTAIRVSPRLLTWRTKYISKIRKYREKGRNIVYLDETWFHNHDVLLKGWMDDSGKCYLDTPVSRGKRIIIFHNVSYHSKQENKIPTNNSSRKSDKIEFLQKNNISYAQKNTKKILLQLIADSEIDKSKQYRVDDLAKEQGCEVN
jgi:hypothetical protein